MDITHQKFWSFMLCFFAWPSTSIKNKKYYFLGGQIFFQGSIMQIYLFLAIASFFAGKIWNEPIIIILVRQWIGQRDYPNSCKYVMANESNSWRWSTAGETCKPSFQFWGPANPNILEDKEKCVLINNGKWFDGTCDLEKSFACYTGEKIWILYIFYSNRLQLIEFI